MNKTWLILRNEIITIFSRPSFLFALFGIPFIGATVFFIAGQLSKGSNPTQNILSQLISSPPAVQTEGYMDQSGIIKQIPSDVPKDVLKAFPDEAQAILALNQGEISAYYIIPPDYLVTGDITNVRPDFNPLGGSGQSHWLKAILTYNMFSDNPELASRINRACKCYISTLYRLPPSAQRATC